MASIYYETSDGEVYQIDRNSQRIVVYVYLHRQTRIQDVVDPANAENEDLVHSRVKNQLGSSAAGLINTTTSNQMTLDGETSDTTYLELTQKGKRFAEKHRDELSMPVEVAELAKRVAELQIENGLVENLIDRIDSLEDRLEELNG